MYVTDRLKRCPLESMHCLAGFLPFSAIYIELYYIFASVWGHKVYTIYSILFIVFIILIIVTAFITVALTYFQLAVEDYTWWWRSFVCGGSTGDISLGNQVGSFKSNFKLVGYIVPVQGRIADRQLHCSTTVAISQILVLLYEV